MQIKSGIYGSETLSCVYLGGPALHVEVAGQMAHHQVVLTPLELQLDTQFGLKQLQCITNMSLNHYRGI